MYTTFINLYQTVVYLCLDDFGLSGIVNFIFPEDIRGSIYILMAYETDFIPKKSLISFLVRGDAQNLIRESDILEYSDLASFVWFVLLDFMLFLSELL